MKISTTCRILEVVLLENAPDPDPLNSNVNVDDHVRVPPDDDQDRPVRDHPAAVHDPPTAPVVECSFVDVLER